MTGRSLQPTCTVCSRRASAAAALLRWAGLARPREIDHAARREQALDRLADTIESECNLERLLSAS